MHLLKRIAIQIARRNHHILYRTLLVLLLSSYFSPIKAGMLQITQDIPTNSTTTLPDINVPTGKRFTVVKIALDLDANGSNMPLIEILSGGGSSTTLSTPGEFATIDSINVFWINEPGKVITLTFADPAPLVASKIWRISITNKDTDPRSFFIAYGNNALQTDADNEASIPYIDFSKVDPDATNFGERIIHDTPIQNNLFGNPAFKVCNRGTGELIFTSATTSDMARFQVITTMDSLSVNPVECTDTSADIVLQFTPADVEGASTADLVFVFNNLTQSPETFSSLMGISEKLELVLALDISGSMGWLPDGTGANIQPGIQPPPETRLGRLKEATNNFVSLLYDYATEGGAHNPSAEFATVLFPARTGIALTGTPINLNDLDAVKLAAVNGVITTLPVGNWQGTPMGEGILSAATEYSAELFHRHALLLFTDGAHNTGTNPEDPSIVGPCDPNPQETPPGVIQEKDIVLFPFAYGTPASSNVEHDVLSRLSLCSGNNVDIFNDPGTGEPLGGNLVTYFNKVFNQMLDKQLAADPNTSIKFGDTNEHVISITEYDTTASFTVAWEPHNQEILETYLIAPNGTKIDSANAPNIGIYEGASYRTIIIRGETLTTPENIGDWRLIVKYNQQTENSSEKIRYSYDAMLSSMLRMDVYNDKDELHTGDIIPVSVSLREQGQAIQGADVFLVVERPDDGLGNWFAENVISEKDLEKIPASRAGEPMTLLERKTQFLRTVKGIDLPKLKLQRNIPLYDNETHGDKKAGDGIYTNSIKIKQEGVHSFLITATGETRNGNHFQRQSMVQKVATINLDPNTLADGIKLIKAKAQPFFPAELVELLEQPVPEGFKRRSIVFTPKDSGGNYWGPGHANEISFSLRNAEAVGPVVDVLMGSYFQVIQYKIEDKPSASVTARGVTAEDVLLKETPFWLWFGGFILVLLLAI